ncbi:MAG: hypothetical protein ABR559_05285 [Gemmatimonadota bacterium]
MNNPVRALPIVRLMFAAMVLATSFGAARDSFAQAPNSTYRVILYIAESGGPTDVSLQRLTEVWSEADGAAKLRALLSTGAIQRLDDVTILPGRDTPAIQLGDVTVRVKGVYKEPRRDSMFLRVEVDGGREALVKEMISRFDETIVLAYPLAEGDRSIIALILPAESP